MEKNIGGAVSCLPRWTFDLCLTLPIDSARNVPSPEMENPSKDCRKIKDPSGGFAALRSWLRKEPRQPSLQAVKEKSRHPTFFEAPVSFRRRSPITPWPEQPRRPANGSLRDSILRGRRGVAPWNVSPVMQSLACRPTHQHPLSRSGTFLAQSFGSYPFG